MRFFSLACILVLLANSAADGRDYEVGDRVMVISKAKLIAADRTEADEVDLGLFLQVTAVDGEKLWVSNGRPGWLDEKHVVPAAEALGYLTARNEQDRDNLKVALALAQLRSERREFDAAILLYNDLIERNSGEAVFFNNRGICWIEKGEIEKGIADFNQSIRLNPRDARAFHNRGDAWHQIGKVDKAIEDFEQSIKLAPNFAGSYRSLGDVWADKGEPEKAIQFYDQAIEIDPMFATAYFNRAFLWESLGNRKNALADLGRVIKADPNFASAYNARAWIRATCPDATYRDGRLACIDATIALQLAGENDPGTLDTLAAANAEAGDFESAIKWQTKACQLATGALKADLETRLELYKKGKPYRQTSD